MPLSPPLSMYFGKLLSLILSLHSWCLREELLWVVNINKSSLGFKNFLLLNSCKLSHNKNVIKFYSWMSIIVEHWNIVQLTSHNNILGLVVLILVVVPLSTNCSLIKGIKIFFGKLKFDYDISSQSSDFILDLDLNACNIFRFGFVAYENLQCSWICCFGTFHCSSYFMHFVDIIVFQFVHLKFII